MLPSAALASALLLVGAHGSPKQGPQAGAALEGAHVVWSYDTGG